MNKSITISEKLHTLKLKLNILKFVKMNCCKFQILLKNENETWKLNCEMISQKSNNIKQSYIIK